MRLRKAFSNLEEFLVEVYLDGKLTEDFLLVIG